jgi:copper resistance protein B
MARRCACALAACALLTATGTGAQTPGADPNVAAPFGQPIEDRRIYLHGFLDEFEARISGDKSFRWDGQAWIGTDRNRLWLKSEGEVTNGTVSDGIQEILYARAITPYFDLQTGVRLDLDSGPARAWGAFGIQGLVPYFFNLELTGYVRDGGHFAARVVASYDLLLTQRLILQPQAELNVYSKSDRARAIGSGPADLDAGLRLRYEVWRQMAPYVGVVYERKFGDTATFARRQGEKTSDVRFTFGVRSWW